MEYALSKMGIFIPIEKGSSFILNSLSYEYWEKYTHFYIFTDLYMSYFVAP